MNVVLLLSFLLLFYLLVTKNTTSDKEKFSGCVKPWISKNPYKQCSKKCQKGCYKQCYNPYEHDVEYIFIDNKITKINVLYKQQLVHMY